MSALAQTHDLTGSRRMMLHQGLHRLPKTDLPHALLQSVQMTQHTAGQRRNSLSAAPTVWSIEGAVLGLHSLNLCKRHGCDRGTGSSVRIWKPFKAAVWMLTLSLSLTLDLNASYALGLYSISPDVYCMLRSAITLGCRLSEPLLKVVNALPAAMHITVFSTLCLYCSNQA